MIFPEALLHRVQVAICGQPFDGRDLHVIGLHGQHGARFQRDAVQVHGAGAALAGITANFGARQIQRLAQEVHQQQARLHIPLVGLAVDGDGYLHNHCLLCVFPVIKSIPSGDFFPQRGEESLAHHIGRRFDEPLPNAREQATDLRVGPPFEARPVRRFAQSDANIALDAAVLPLALHRHAIAGRWLQLAQAQFAGVSAADGCHLQLGARAKGVFLAIDGFQRFDAGQGARDRAGVMQDLPDDGRRRLQIRTAR